MIADYTGGAGRRSRGSRCPCTSLNRAGASATCASTPFHQGDKDGVKGISHINAVDCVKWEIVTTCERLSEAYLLTVAISKR
jgi:hypothetical protein